MKSNAALKNQIINDAQIQGLLAMRESLDSLKKRYELLENSVKTTEIEIISLIESGALVSSDHQLQIRAIERRYPHWKEHFAVLSASTPGAPTTEEILANTSVSVTKTLIVK